ncbi:MAG: hypothetical protein U5L02_01255 [Rheinheimera sp.]|nr:hypothetical protein [Rheinheimera sp.]
MHLLWLVTAIWAFSFSLIGEFLAATVDPYLAVSSRMLLALLLFSPFFMRHRTAPLLALQLAGIGAVQLGLMYLLLYHSFLYLKRGGSAVIHHSDAGVYLSARLLLAL